ncbi:MAG: tRNA uridine-5-carboxymethylaminomethyl(34) synthesis enzyme MnmG [Bacilli bacterium]|jgi:tRNA uridine 5-carboxymethylaminomethyl modification enzyme
MFDLIVVGAGHAGIEAALAGVRLGFKVCLLTLDINNIASLPCNPSIGGPAKGVVVREIDALGGEMAKAADATYLQMKILNTKKGPGVRCLRCQSDKLAYVDYMKNLCLSTPNLEVKEAMVTAIIVENNRCLGVVLEDGTKLLGRITILTTGTYLEASILRGHTSIKSGPDGQRYAYGLSKSLAEHGLEIRRFKTGTPPRIKADTIDFSKMKLEPGSPGNLAFSYSTTSFIPLEEQSLCYLIHTTPKTHEIIRQNLESSAMYGGLVTGIGPRYCPSVEDKIVKFADKERHQLFVEPESKRLNTVYLQGFSTSMPEEIQKKMIYSLPGFENCEILKYAYAIEYDCINPLELKPTLESKKIVNLFCAGQINGTSGYEEAAGQGLMAGINACLKLQGKKPFILRRDESYIGLMIDDLTTKGTNEPYRLLTSRSEYRLLLRHNNADLRLREYGYQVGLISQEQYTFLLQKKHDIEELQNILKKTHFSFKHPINKRLIENDLSPIDGSASAHDLLKRPFLKFSLLEDYLKLKKKYSDEVVQEVEIQTKYAGYLKKQEETVQELLKLESLSLDPEQDYNLIPNLASEACQKLNKVKPLNLGQASRISGVNPSDITILLIHLRTKEANNG